MEIAKPIHHVVFGVDLDAWIEKLEGLAPLPGRVLLAAIFLWSGWGKVFGWDQAAGYMQSKGMPLIPVLLALALLVELAGGLALLTGLRARLAALVLFGYLIPTTVIFHAFWSSPPDQSFMQLVNFMKNVSIMGGLLMVVGLGAGRWSVDDWWKRRRAVAGGGE